MDSFLFRRNTTLETKAGAFKARNRRILAHSSKAVPGGLIRIVAFARAIVKDERQTRQRKTA